MVLGVRQQAENCGPVPGEHMSGQHARSGGHTSLPGLWGSTRPGRVVSANPPPMNDPAPRTSHVPRVLPARGYAAAGNGPATTEQTCWRFRTAAS